MHLVDELCDLNPASRCHMFQRLRRCLVPFVADPAGEKKHDEADASTLLSADLLEWIDRLFEGRPRQTRKAVVEKPAVSCAHEERQVLVLLL